MFITLNSVEANQPVIINIRYLVGVMTDDTGQSWVKAGSDPAFKIKETSAQVEEILRQASLLISQ